MRKLYPVGTRFRIHAKETDREAASRSYIRISTGRSRLLNEFCQSLSVRGITVYAATTKEITQALFRLAAFNIAPERGEKLATESFGSGNGKCGQAKPTQIATRNLLKRLYLSYLGLASLWCAAYLRIKVAATVGALHSFISSGAPFTAIACK
jgi:hypothetical protein